MEFCFNSFVLISFSVLIAKHMIEGETGDLDRDKYRWAKCVFTHRPAEVLLQYCPEHGVQYLVVLEVYGRHSCLVLLV